MALVSCFFINPSVVSVLMVLGFAFVGGVVYSSFEPLVRAESLVIVGDRVVYV